MEHSLQALHVIQEAEAELRRLIGEALGSQSYRDVGLIASMADKLAAIHRDVDLEKGRMPSGDPAAAESRPGSMPLLVMETPAVYGRSRASKTRIRPRRSPSQVAAADGYPKFLRDGDRLVKIGWSKQDERAYEHKAPRVAVSLFVEKVRETVPPATVFSMDRFLPLRDANQQEIPSYQAYAVMAWLRSSGAIERRTKEGYSYTAGALDAERVEQLWLSLPERS